MKIHCGIILVVVLLLTGSTAIGEKMYKYKDENGVLHFTNIAPTTDQPIETKQIRVADKESKVTVNNVGTKQKTILSVWNGYGGPVQIEFELLKNINISTSPLLPARFIIPAQSTKKVVRIWPTRKNRSWSYQYNYRLCLGDFDVTHKTNKPYRAPFQVGKAFKVSQGFYGKYSHNHPGSEYAIDIKMPEGSEICAARKGVVMDISNDFFSGGTDKDKYYKRANIVRILHDDGTMAIYGHLKLESILFGIGKTVLEGEVIAESGNTGYSSGPHLHFAIQQNFNMELKSIPFKFANAEGHAAPPEEGVALQAY